MKLPDEIPFFSSSKLIAAFIISLSFIIAAGIFSIKEIKFLSDGLNMMGAVYDQQITLNRISNHIYRLSLLPNSASSMDSAETRARYMDFRTQIENDIKRLQEKYIDSDTNTAESDEFPLENSLEKLLQLAYSKLSYIDNMLQKALDGSDIDSYEIGIQLEELSRSFDVEDEQNVGTIDLAIRDGLKYTRKTVILFISSGIIGIVTIFLLFVITLIQKSRTQMLAEAYREESIRANAAVKAKSNFLANMSHEIRTPLNAIIGFSDLLAEPLADEEEKTRYISGIKKGGRMLLELINDILDLSKLEVEKGEAAEEPFSPYRLIDELVEMFSYTAGKKNISIEINNGEPASEEIIFYSDRQRIRQILLNLIGNAVKFTEVGSVSVGMHVMPKSKSSEGFQLCDVAFYVSDTGIGISQEKLETIFDPFMQADSGINRIYGGTGLGLAISQRIAEVLGGELTVASEVSKGSRFTLKLSDMRVSTNKEQSDRSGRTGERTSRGILNGITILITDDDLPSRQLLSAYLVFDDVTVLEASDAREALEILEENNVDLLVMDIHMEPGKSGIEVVADIRNSDADYRNIPVLWITASAENDCLEDLRKRNERVLLKPVNSEEFRSAVTGVLSYRKSDATGEPGSCLQLTISSGEVYPLSSEERRLLLESPLPERLEHSLRSGSISSISEIGVLLYSLGEKADSQNLMNTGAALQRYTDLLELDEINRVLRDLKIFIKGGRL